jgi:hypothetical protein
MPVDVLTTKAGTYLLYFETMLRQGATLSDCSLYSSVRGPLAFDPRYLTALTPLPPELGRTGPSTFPLVLVFGGSLKYGGRISNCRP